MSIVHEPLLVVLSLIVAIQASYVGLRLAAWAAVAAGLRRRALLAGAAGTLGVGIWGMHFVGMLAARLPVPVDYIVLPTLISFLLCVLVVGLAIVIASMGSPGGLRLSGAALAMGGGIALMHYTGMQAIHASAHLVHDPRYVAASLAVGVAASGLGLWLAFGEGRRTPLYAGALALGIAISGTHYVAMAGLTLHPMVNAGVAARLPALSPDLLALVVAVVAFLVSGLFFLTLVPDGPPASAATAVPDRGSTGRAGAVLSSARPASAPSAAAPTAPASALAPDRFEGPAETDPGLGVASAGPPVAGLSVQREGRSIVLPLDDIHVIHANAHYTYVSNGQVQYFCSLPIGDVEAILPADRFMRVHRSHIVNLARITQVRRSGDNGVAELDSPVRTVVPVSRAKLPELRNRIATRTMAAE